jgi:hypothetical protein
MTQYCPLTIWTISTNPIEESPRVYCQEDNSPICWLIHANVLSPFALVCLHSHRTECCSVAYNRISLCDRLSGRVASKRASNKTASCSKYRWLKFQLFRNTSREMYFWVTGRTEIPIHFFSQHYHVSEFSHDLQGGFWFG